MASLEQREGVPSVEEIEKLITEYTKQGISPTLIGQYLKDKHNVPYIRAAMKKRLGAFLKEKKLEGELPQDLVDLIRKALRMRRHLESNKQDVHNRVSLGKIEAKVWRLSRYYKKEGVLPADWKYDPEKAALTIKS